jgi:Arm domain-containing DNA-binding protein
VCRPVCVSCGQRSKLDNPAEATYIHIMSIPLSEETIDATPAPEKGYVELRERGLVLRIFHTGRQEWSYEYRSPATGKNARIGVPARTLAEARAIADGFRVDVASGRDPKIETLEARIQRQERVNSHRVEYKRKLPILKAMRWAQKNGADVTLHADGSYSFTFRALKPQ